MGPIVVIEWGDAWHTLNEPEVPDVPIALVTVGFLHSESEEGVTVVSEYPVKHPEDGRHFKFIPWVNVTKMEVIEDA